MKLRSAIYLELT